MKIKKLKLLYYIIPTAIAVGVGLFFVQKNRPTGKVLAIVGNTVLTDEEFYNLIPTEQLPTLTFEEKAELLRKWIDSELLYQEGKKMGIDKNKIIKAKIKQVERELVANEFINEYTIKIPSVSELEVKEYFDSRKAFLNTERKVAHILVRDEFTARQIDKELREGASFADLAQKYSIDPSGKEGGLIGNIRFGDMALLPEFEEKVFSMKIGEISEPIQTIYGYHIIKLIDIKKLDKELEYADVSEIIRNRLNLAKKKRALDELLLKLRKEKKVKENYDLLRG